MSERDELIELLVRLIVDGVMDEDQALGIIQIYDQTGQLPEDWQLPLPFEESLPDDLPAQITEILRSAPLEDGFLAFAIDVAQQNFAATVTALGNQLQAKTITLKVWQRKFRDALIEFLATAAAAGAEKDISATEDEDQVLGQVQVQLAYLSRFGDTVAINAITAGMIIARSNLYSGEGRAMFFEQKGKTNALWGWVEDYIALDDKYTCAPCRNAEANGPYLPGDPASPQPGRECLGRGYCRCVKFLRYDPQTYLRLSGQVQAATPVPVTQ